jgi:Aspartyl protease
MVSIAYRDELVYVPVTLFANGKQIHLPNVLLDTGSANCLFDADTLRKIDVTLTSDDPILVMGGVGGGIEYVVEKRLDRLEVGTLSTENILITVGALDYDFPFDGILGLDFLLKTNAVIDFKSLELRASSSASRR